MKSLVLILISFSALILKAQDQPVIRISGDQLSREYRILFSGQNEENVDITLLDQSEKELISQTVYGSGFVKLFDLSKLKPGVYTWQVKYDSRSHNEKIEIVSEKDLLKNSFEVDFSNFFVDIKVKEYNNLPMNIFVYNENGEQINYEFWEPGEESRNKKIDISQFAAKEIRLEIEQKGSLAYSESYAIY